MIETPVVRIRPSPPDPTRLSPSGAPRRRAARSRERRTGPHGFTRVLRGSGAERSAYLVQRSRQAVSAAFRYSLPHRGPKTVASGLASLNLARPFRARPEDRRRFKPAPPSPTSLPYSASRAADSVIAGLPSPATFRPQRFSRSRRLAPRDPARACFIPVTLMGF